MDRLKDDFIVEDEHVEALIDPNKIKRAQKEADERRKALSIEDWHKLRIRAKRDLFFLSYGVLGYTRLSTNLHGELCTLVHDTAGYQFREWLLPRAHFKSTILTIADSIRIVLPYTDDDAKYDDSDTEIPWPECLGTDCRLLIGHETAEGAARFLYAITNHFVSNPVLMALFPEAVPSKRIHRINKWELELPRSRVFPEPTIDTMGVGAKSQGRHYNKIKLDDIYGDKARDSEAEDATTKEWVDNIQAFFDTLGKDKLDFIGTRYKFDDVYGHINERYGTQIFVYRRSVEEPDESGKKVPIFPEEIATETLAILRKNKAIFNAQYLNNPSEDETGFQDDWKRYFYWISPTTIAVFSGTERTLIDVRDLDLCILIDPGVDKSGGFIVTGMDYMGRVFCLQSIRLELKPPDLVELIFKSVARWMPRLVAIESDIFANTYQYWLRSEMQKRGTFFHVEPVYTKKKAKDFRIGGLSNYFSAGQIYFNEKQADLEREYDEWGKTRDIHILDALAYGPELWHPGWAPGTRSTMHDTLEVSTDNRDTQTGYSAIN